MTKHVIALAAILGLVLLFSVAVAGIPGKSAEHRQDDYTTCTLENGNTVVVDCNAVANFPGTCEPCSGLPGCGEPCTPDVGCSEGFCSESGTCFC